MAPLLELFRLYPDALHDTHYAAYALLVVAPLTFLASSLLVYRGKKTTPLHVYLVSLAVPTLAVYLPMVRCISRPLCLLALVIVTIGGNYTWNCHYRLQWYWPEEKNVYKLLSMSRQETRYQWSQKYAFFRKHFQSGAMSLEAWKQIDAAYDNIYNEKSRYLYDFWGPGQKMTLYETQVNVGLFYLLWFVIIYTVTTPKATQAASKVSYVGLIALMCIELAVRLTQIDPVVKEIAPFTTPREFLLWSHRFFPILVFTTVSIKKVYFIDLEKHHQRVLAHMLKKNMETVEELRSLNQELMPNSESSEETLKKKKQ